MTHDWEIVVNIYSSEIRVWKKSNLAVGHFDLPLHNHNVLLVKSSYCISNRRRYIMYRIHEFSPSHESGPHTCHLLGPLFNERNDLCI